MVTYMPSVQNPITNSESSICPLCLFKRVKGDVHYLTRAYWNENIEETIVAKETGCNFYQKSDKDESR